MPTPYTSIFDSPTIITKKDLCEILNLDTSVPGLMFSAAEINKAYKLRARRFHPDSQKRFPQPIPTEACNILMNDIAKARDYLLAGEENIPGKGFNLSPEADSIKGAFSNVMGIISKLNKSHLSILIALSTYSDKQLNLGLINKFEGFFNIIKKIDDQALAELLNEAGSDQPNPTELCQILNKSQIDSQYHALIILVLTTLKDELNTSNINEILEMHRYISNAPSWGLILGVYFNSMLMSASSIPKFFNAIKVIDETIWKQKGILQFLLFGIPLNLLSIAFLPINVALHASFQLTVIGIREAFHVLTNALQLALSTIWLGLSLIFTPHRLLTKGSTIVDIIESLMNLTVRLLGNIILQPLNEGLFILTDHNLLGSAIEMFNSALDSFIECLRPERVTHEVEAEDEQALILVEDDDNQTPEEHQPAEQDESVFGFFSATSSNVRLNQKDTWLKKILDSINEDPDLSPASAAASSSISM